MLHNNKETRIVNHFLVKHFSLENLVFNFVAAIANNFEANHLQIAADGDFAKKIFFDFSEREPLKKFANYYSLMQNHITLKPNIQSGINYQLSSDSLKCFAKIWFCLNKKKMKQKISKDFHNQISMHNNRTSVNQAKPIFMAIIKMQLMSSEKRSEVQLFLCTTKRDFGLCKFMMCLWLVYNYEI